jgi:hypothetical protein
MEMAVRKPLGLTPVTTNLFTDNTEKSLWAWELLFPHLHLCSSLQLKSQTVRFNTQHKSALLKQAHKCSSSKKPKDAQAYFKLVSKWEEAQEKQKAKLLKQQLKVQEEEVKAKMLQEELKQKEILRQQKEQEKAMI